MPARRKLHYGEDGDHIFFNKIILRKGCSDSSVLVENKVVILFLFELGLFFITAFITVK